MKKCSICKEPKEDVFTCIIKSKEPVKHTYWNFDICIGCRDAMLYNISKQGSQYDEKRGSDEVS